MSGGAGDRAGKRRLGEILVERGFVSPDQLREALRVQYQEGKRLGEILVEMGALSMDELNWALSELLNIPYVEFREEMVDLELARTLPEDLLRRHETFPVLRVGGRADRDHHRPHQPAGRRRSGGGHRAKVSIAIASRETLAPPPRPGVPRREIDRQAPGVRYAEVGAGQGAVESDPTGVAQVYALLLGALREDATEVHVEPLADEMRVRNRVEGRLVERARLPEALLTSGRHPLPHPGGTAGRSGLPPEPRPHAPRAARGGAGAAVLPDDPGRSA